ncbi:NYN domain-containing protein [Novosphingobium colocasiae]|uniref:NYN domain-containing protein n=1 Tax=Novosphingobium colocasiae TaxID=1256513 RepID=A0A918PGV9_9SPHN|nr:NYN domain-containing protein [Novosphingobium colocasiae]GGZ05297.1 hypothetical protein GCM10011614_20290 [Novosphingobium colocasiae]
MNGNYFFIDGSALMAQIRQLQRAQPIFKNRKLCVHTFVNYQMRSLLDLHGGNYKRATFYFASGDEANVGEFFRSPEYATPGKVRDLQFKYCGHKLKKSAEFEKFVDELVPPKFHNRFQKSEKGVDIEICCDALKLASASRLERLFLLTNDGDFLPLFRAIKEFGANISLIHLTSSIPPNMDLVREADTYDVVSDLKLNEMFFPQEFMDLALLSNDEKDKNRETELEVRSEKPEAAPSDLDTVVDPSEQEG